jgi:predicted TIM-barrel fold metal-dependent hydrolase
MTTRRDLLKGVASGLAFCGCGMLEAAHAQGTYAVNPNGRNPKKPTKLPVSINGKRVKTIDTHAHCLFQPAIDLMGEEARGVMPPVKGQKEHLIWGDAGLAMRLEGMDSQAIDMEILSINPFWYRKDRETAGKICQLQNEKLAEFCASKPDRFAAFASIPMQFPDLAVQMLETAMKKQGLKGAAIGGSVNGEDFSDAKFRPILAKAEELGAVLFIHPQSTPQLAARFKGNGWLSNLIGNPLDTTIALQHLIFEGVLDKHPGLKVLAAHGGGYLGSYPSRGDHACFVSPQNCDANVVLKKKPSEYVKQIYFDALVFTPSALQHLVNQVGAGQVVLGTDHPIPWEQTPVDHVFDTKTLSDKQKEMILGGNAAKLFGIKL